MSRFRSMPRVYRSRRVYRAKPKNYSDRLDIRRVQDYLKVFLRRAKDYDRVLIRDIRQLIGLVDDMYLTSLRRGFHRKTINLARSKANDVAMRFEEMGDRAAARRLYQFSRTIGVAN